MCLTQGDARGSYNVISMTVCILHALSLKDVSLLGLTARVDQRGEGTAIIRTAKRKSSLNVLLGAS